MARTELTVYTLTRAGIPTTAAYMTAAIADGHSFVNDGSTFIVVSNASGSPVTATVLTPGNVDGNAIADLSITVPASGRVNSGTFPKSVYNQSDGSTYVDYSATTGVTIMVIRIPKEVLP